MEQHYISSNLKFLRLQKKVSQKKISEICNKSNTAISNWEKGIREPSAIDLITMCNFFGVSIDDFVKKDLRVESSNEHEKTISHY